MQIPIVSGIFADGSPEFRTSYPINMVPIPKQQGISAGYLKPAEGLVELGTGPGKSRGGIEWEGVCYRVMGTTLVEVQESGAVLELGTIPGTDTVSMAYSFDRLAIAGDDRLFYWDGSTLTEVTDTDLGTVLDVVWVDGYFMTTDGEFLVVTELNDPTAVDPLKYGSSEVDPDPVKALCKIRNEIYAVNRYTIEVFSNVGGTGFPFQRITGAQVTRGAVGTHAAREFGESVAFVGGGRDESIGVFVAAGGTSAKISTREIDELLAEETEEQLEAIQIEVRKDRSNDVILIHTSKGTLCYDNGGTQALGQPLWYKLSSSIDGQGVYRGRHLVWCYNDWLIADALSAKVGRISRDTGPHFGDMWGWEFGTPVIYNEARGGIIHSLEIVSLTGSAPFGANTKISAEYSEDGVTWSQPKWIDAGTFGQRMKRLRWMRQGLFRQRRMYRFRGNSDGPIAPARLEAEIEGLSW